MPHVAERLVVHKKVHIAVLSQQIHIDMTSPHKRVGQGSGTG